MVHIMKDSMILSIGGGFKAVPILKAIGIPFTILFSIIYNHFLNKYSIKNIFVYFMISTILCLYVFSFILIKHYMYIDRSTYNAMQTTIVMWPISIFYIISDFWIAASGSLLFWKMLNTSFNHEQAENNYNFFIAFGNLGMIISGSIGYMFANQIKEGVLIIQTISLIILFSISIIVILIYYLESSYLTKMRIEHMKNKPKITEKMSTWRSLQYLSNSRYLIKMFMIALILSVIHVISDNPFKKLIHEEFPIIYDLIGFMSISNILMGIFSILINIQSRKIFNKFGWINSAIVTPILIGSMSIILCIGLYYNYYINQQVLLFIGTLQFIVSKGLKSSLFVFTFEMLFIPLNLEMQKKGKIAISLIASRIGKTIGSIILILIQDYSNFLLINSIIIFILCSVWIYIVYKIYTQYKKLIEDENKELT